MSPPIDFSHEFHTLCLEGLATISSDLRIDWLQSSLSVYNSWEHPNPFDMLGAFNPTDDVATGPDHFA